MPTPQSQQGMQISPTAMAVTKAIAYTENGGAPNLSNPSAGQSGELKSIFQFEPSTWQAYAKQVMGSSNVPMNTDTESYVVASKVQHWLDQGYTEPQIFSMWNAGPGEPNAYSGEFSDGSSSSGTNKHGVKYNVPKYVDTAMNYYKEFSSQPAQLSANQNNTQPQANPNPATASMQQNPPPLVDLDSFRNSQPGPVSRQIGPKKRPLVKVG